MRDTAIESSVMTKVKGFGEYNNRIMDTADYVTPTQVNHNKYFVDLFYYISVCVHMCMCLCVQAIPGYGKIVQ